MNQYQIIRPDLLLDPVTVITEGLLIGRLPQCELLLNHPSVSRVQAGIKQVENDYYLFALRPKNPVLLNGKPVEENEALAPGDLIEVGPFHLEVDVTENILTIRVELRIGMKPSEIDVSDPGLSTDNLVVPEAKAKRPRPAPIAGTKALDIFWDKRMREVGKMVRPSPLFPKTGRRSGKEQFKWIPTTDLMSRWPVAFFTWALLVVGLISVAAAYGYTNAFAPAPISKAHDATRFTLVPAIANEPNAGACTTCHSFNEKLEVRCVSCHTAEGFVATTIKPHEAAGIGCIDCHAEHQGTAFSAAEGALASCTTCHNDNNQARYNGRKVGTPHGGTFGYPVVNGSWSAKSINEEEWELRALGTLRQPTDTDEKWRSNQFHALHDQRVRLVPGLKGNSEGNLSCSSCHNSFDPLDRETPKTTCAACHNGRIETGTNRVIIAKDRPNCTSCHVEHIRDAHRWSASLVSENF